MVIQILFNYYYVKKWKIKSNESLFNEALDIVNNDTNKQSTKYLLKPPQTPNNKPTQTQNIKPTQAPKK